MKKIINIIIEAIRAIVMTLLIIASIVAYLTAKEAFGVVCGLIIALYAVCCLLAPDERST